MTNLLHNTWGWTFRILWPLSSSLHWQNMLKFPWTTRYIFKVSKTWWLDTYLSTSITWHMNMKINSESLLMSIYVEFMTLEILGRGFGNCLQVQCIYLSSLFKNQCYKHYFNRYTIDFCNNDTLRYISCKKYYLCISVFKIFQNDALSRHSRLVWMQ